MKTRSKRSQLRNRITQARVHRLRPSRWLPLETRVHLRNAGRENLLVARSLLDAAITRLDDDHGTDSASKR